MTRIQVSPSFQIMGVLNITPDSFSDGGKFLNTQQAVDHGLRLMDAGASILDLGAESTRPGATPVSDEEEEKRLLPVLEILLGRIPGKSLSVDTRRKGLALKVAKMGVGYINNVEGLFDDDVMKTISSLDCRYIAMHMHGEPQRMQINPLNKDAALISMDKFVERAVGAFDRTGFATGSCFVDPGIGFGKTDAANLALLAKLPQYSKQCRMALGISRKSMFGRLLGIEEPENRDSACKVVEFLLGVLGADIIRTHDVATLAHIRKIYDAGN